MLTMTIWLQNTHVRPELLGLLLFILLDGFKLALTLTAGQVDVGHVVVRLLGWGQGGPCLCSALPAGRPAQRAVSGKGHTEAHDWCWQNTVINFAMLVKMLHAELRQALDS